MGFEGAKNCVEYHRSHWTYLITCWLLCFLHWFSINFFKSQLADLKLGAAERFSITWITVSASILSLSGNTVQSVRGNTLLFCQILKSKRLLTPERRYQWECFGALHSSNTSEIKWTTESKGTKRFLKINAFLFSSFQVWNVNAVIKPVRWAFTYKLFSVLKFWPVTRGVKGGGGTLNLQHWTLPVLPEFRKFGDPLKKRPQTATDVMCVWTGLCFSDLMLS